MAGDYTRMTFKTRKDYSGVLMQQGRVTLDADWNELVEALDHRLRAEIVDTLGRCVYSKETPDAFQIAAAGGSLTIGPGRAYVDGLLVENHGAEPLEYDPVMGELRGTAPIDFAKQPYFPNAPAAPGHGDHTSPTSTSGSARSRTWRTRISSRRRSPSTRQRGSRTPGRWVSSKPTPERPATQTCRAGTR